MFEGIYLCQADRADSQEEHVQAYICDGQKCRWVSRDADYEIAVGHIRSGFGLSSSVIGVRIG